ncbi:hypothetical protein BpHYR1_021389 [Brachionus plicatilis]|uniref:Uncharacterized protein n=1 Tax=Brachionus plicatilis TaxID=10195 RepID=A0A3M7PI44_BRAPC|nr:hypothetical protein BpHYR1_021389 [Brachionus plicatilis]
MCTNISEHHYTRESYIPSIFTNEINNCSNTTCINKQLSQFRHAKLAGKISASTTISAKSTECFAI